MKKWIYHCLFFCVLSILFLGCASTRHQPPNAEQAAELKEAYRQIVKDYKVRMIKLYNLAYPLQRAAVNVSPHRQVGYDFGFLYAALDHYEKDIEPYKREVLIKEFGFDTHKPFAVYVWYVLKNSPADTAGMQPGDRIVAVMNKRFKSSKDFKKKWKTPMMMDG